MPPPATPAFFNQEHAAQYDQRSARLAPMRDALNWLMGVILAGLPADARILCVGAGTGAELLYLAQQHPQWRFTAVDPSGPMLDVCRRRTQEAGIESRCTFHAGYLDSLPEAEPFDAATSIFVSQFILAPAARIAFFQAMAVRLRPGGYLVSADLASDTKSAEYEKLLEIWLRLMKTADLTVEQVENMRTAYGRDVAILPLPEVSRMIAAGGFETPQLFLQTVLIHAWYARRSPSLP